DVMSRRLNRNEYENTLRDLLGVALDVAEMFPADGAGREGFDNEGRALFLAAIPMEKYLAAADLAVETALPPRSSATLGAVDDALRTKSEQAVADRYAALLGAPPAGDQDPRAAARAALASFAGRAWRKPADEASLE